MTGRVALQDGRNPRGHLVEIREIVARLRSFLAEDGVLAFSFIDPYFTPPDGWALADEWPGLDNLSWRLAASREHREPEMDVAGLAARAATARLTWATLVNHEHLVVDSGEGWCEEGNERTQYLVFCTEEYMRSIYPDAEIRPPARPERHSCVVLRQPSG